MAIFADITLLAEVMLLNEINDANGTNFTFMQLQISDVTTIPTEPTEDVIIDSVAYRIARNTKALVTFTGSEFAGDGVFVKYERISLERLFSQAPVVIKEIDIVVDGVISVDLIRTVLNRKYGLRLSNNKFTITVDGTRFLLEADADNCGYVGGVWFTVGESLVSRVRNYVLDGFTLPMPNKYSMFDFSELDLLAADTLVDKMGSSDVLKTKRGVIEGAGLGGYPNMRGMDIVLPNTNTENAEGYTVAIEFAPIKDEVHIYAKNSDGKFISHLPHMDKLSFEGAGILAFADMAKDPTIDGWNTLVYTVEPNTTRVYMGAVSATFPHSLMADGDMLLSCEQHKGIGGAVKKIKIFNSVLSNAQILEVATAPL